MPAPSATVDQQFRTILIRDIIEHPANPREHFDELEELAASIVAVGLLEPIIVESIAVPAGPRFRLLAGARRLRAARMARMTELPAIVRRSPKSPAETVALMMIENGQRRPLDPIEEARGYARILGLQSGLSQGDLGRMTGRSQAHVSKRLALLNLTAAEQEEVRSGDMLVRDAQETARERTGTQNVTRYTGWHLGKTHPLAARVQTRCRTQVHTTARRLGGMGCGECWEFVIRRDERDQVLTEQQLIVDPTRSSSSRGGQQVTA